MRISDWSSDVCSSDLADGLALLQQGAVQLDQFVLAALHGIGQLVKAEGDHGQQEQREDGEAAAHAASCMSSSGQTGAAVRTAARSLAERARGLMAVSASPAVAADRKSTRLNSSH